MIPETPESDSATGQDAIQDCLTYEENMQMWPNFKRKDNQEQARNGSTRQGLKAAITVFSEIKESMLIVNKKIQILNVENVLKETT